MVALLKTCAFAPLGDAHEEAGGAADEVRRPHQGQDADHRGPQAMEQAAAEATDRSWPAPGWFLTALTWTTTALIMMKLQDQRKSVTFFYPFALIFGKSLQILKGFVLSFCSSRNATAHRETLIPKARRKIDRQRQRRRQLHLQS